MASRITVFWLPLKNWKKPQNCVSALPTAPNAEGKVLNMPLGHRPILSGMQSANRHGKSSLPSLLA